MFEAIKSVKSSKDSDDYGPRVGVQLQPSTLKVDREAAQSYLESYFGKDNIKVYWQSNHLPGPTAEAGRERGRRCRRAEAEPLRRPAGDPCGRVLPRPQAGGPGPPRRTVVQRNHCLARAVGRWQDVADPGVARALVRAGALPGVRRPHAAVLRAPGQSTAAPDLDVVNRYVFSLVTMLLGDRIEARDAATMTIDEALTAFADGADERGGSSSSSISWKRYSRWNRTTARGRRNSSDSSVTPCGRVGGGRCSPCGTTSWAASGRIGGSSRTSCGRRSGSTSSTRTPPFEAIRGPASRKRSIFDRSGGRRLVDRSPAGARGARRQRPARPRRTRPPRHSPTSHASTPSLSPCWCRWSATTCGASSARSGWPGTTEIAEKDLEAVRPYHRALAGYYRAAVRKAAAGDAGRRAGRARVDRSVSLLTRQLTRRATITMPDIADRDAVVKRLGRVL